MDKAKLSDRIWFTKKARHNAEARLIKTENILSFLLTYYSVFFVVVQIFPKFVVQASSNPLDWIATSSSLFILVFSLLISGQSFKLRAERMKNCYLALSDVEQKLERGVNPDDVFLEFNQVLKRYDNHASYDFDAVNLWGRQNAKETNVNVFIRHFKVLGLRSFCWLLIIVLSVSPVIVLCKYIFPFL